MDMELYCCIWSPVCGYCREDIYSLDPLFGSTYLAYYYHINFKPPLLSLLLGLFGSL